MQSKSYGSENQFKKFKKARTPELPANLCQEAESNNFLGGSERYMVFYNLNFSVIMSLNATVTDSDPISCLIFLWHIQSQIEVLIIITMRALRASNRPAMQRCIPICCMPAAALYCRNIAAGVRSFFNQTLRFLVACRAC